MILFVLPLISTASAESVGGFSTPGARVEHSAGVQVAALFDADRTYAQGTLLVSTHWRNLGLDVDVVGLAGTGTSNWSDAGLGSIRVGVRAFFGYVGFQNAIGVDLRSGFEAPRVGFWVTRYADALTVYTPRLTWDLTLGPGAAPLSMRLTLGYSPTTSGLDGVPVFLGGGTGLSVSKLVPLAPRWDVLAEAELLVDGTPFSVRGGARWHPGDHWAVDAIVGVPMPLFFTHPVFLPALQARGEL